MTTDSLSKEELVEFAVAMSLAELEALRGRLSGVPEPTEEEIKKVKETGTIRRR